MNFNQSNSNIPILSPIFKDKQKFLLLFQKTKVEIHHVLSSIGYIDNDKISEYYKWLQPLKNREELFALLLNYSNPKNLNLQEIPNHLDTLKKSGILDYNILLQSSYNYVKIKLQWNSLTIPFSQINFEIKPLNHLKLAQQKIEKTENAVQIVIYDLISLSKCALHIWITQKELNFQKIEQIEFPLKLIDATIFTTINKMNTFLNKMIQELRNNDSNMAEETTESQDYKQMLDEMLIQEDAFFNYKNTISEIKQEAQKQMRQVEFCEMKIRENANWILSVFDACLQTSNSISKISSGIEPKNIPILEKAAQDFKKSQKDFGKLSRSYSKWKTIARNFQKAVVMYCKYYVQQTQILQPEMYDQLQEMITKTSQKLNEDRAKIQTQEELEQFQKEIAKLQAVCLQRNCIVKKLVNVDIDWEAFLNDDKFFTIGNDMDLFQIIDNLSTMSFADFSQHYLQVFQDLENKQNNQQSNLSNSEQKSKFDNVYDKLKQMESLKLNLVNFTNQIRDFKSKLDANKKLMKENKANLVKKKELKNEKKQIQKEKREKKKERNSILQSLKELVPFFPEFSLDEMEDILLFLNLK
ncbi:protein restricted tev movement 2 [Anaeramoeba ignava]|uniref:Protein restricted tev movement 2 n=1 Tax=Anaeramoeba ignava TaxID=1746090 RepID=A0A9Q0LN11_ANAIG|nr:protein restricted tev movement 2 [Anaeramoeba ignava]